MTSRRAGERAPRIFLQKPWVVGTAGTDNSAMDFEELLAAASKAQSRERAASRDLQDQLDSRETTGKEGDPE